MSYVYCSTCFPDPTKVGYAICNTSLGRPCFSQHVAGEAPIHKISQGIKKKQRTSPRLAAAARARPRRNPGSPARAPPALSSTTGLKVILGLVDVRGGASEGFGACPVVGEGSRYTPGERSDS